MNDNNDYIAALKIIILIKELAHTGGLTITDDNKQDNNIEKMIFVITSTGHLR